MRGSRAWVKPGDADQFLELARAELAVWMAPRNRRSCHRVPANCHPIGSSRSDESCTPFGVRGIATGGHSSVPSLGSLAVRETGEGAPHE